MADVDGQMGGSWSSHGVLNNTIAPDILPGEAYYHDVDLGWAGLAPFDIPNGRHELVLRLAIGTPRRRR